MNKVGSNYQRSICSTPVKTHEQVTWCGMLSEAEGLHAGGWMARM